MHAVHKQRMRIQSELNTAMDDPSGLPGVFTYVRTRVCAEKLYDVMSRDTVPQKSAVLERF